MQRRFSAPRGRSVRVRSRGLGLGPTAGCAAQSGGSSRGDRSRQRAAAFGGWRQRRSGRPAPRLGTMVQRHDSDRTMRRRPDGRRRFRVARRRNQFRRRAGARRERAARRALQHRRPLGGFRKTDRLPALSRTERRAPDLAGADHRRTCAIANWSAPALIVRVSGNLSLTVSELSAKIPPFNPQKLLTDCVAGDDQTRRRRSRTPRFPSSPAISPRRAADQSAAPAVSPATCDITSLLPKVKPSATLPLDDVLTRVRDVANRRRHTTRRCSPIADGTPGLSSATPPRTIPTLISASSPHRAGERHTAAQDRPRRTAATTGASASSWPKKATPSARSCASSAPRPMRSRAILAVLGPAAAKAAQGRPAAARAADRRRPRPRAAAARHHHRATARSRPRRRCPNRRLRAGRHPQRRHRHRRRRGRR